MIEVKVGGLEDLERQLRQMAPNLAKNALRASVNAGAQVIKKEASIARPRSSDEASPPGPGGVPVDTGTLRKAIYVKQIREESGPFQQTYFVGVRKGKGERAKGRDGWYFHLIEFGTSKMPARPFMRPAFENKKNEAFEAIKARLWARIQKIAGKL